MTDARLSEIIVEALTDGSPDVRLSEIVTEVLTDGSPNVRLSHLLVEVLAPSTLVVAPLTIDGATAVISLSASKPSFTVAGATASISVFAIKPSAIVQGATALISVSASKPAFTVHGATASLSISAFPDSSLVIGKRVDGATALISLSSSPVSIDSDRVAGATALISITAYPGSLEKRVDGATALISVSAGAAELFGEINVLPETTGLLQLQGSLSTDLLSDVATGASSTVQVVLVSYGSYEVRQQNVSLAIEAPVYRALPTVVVVMDATAIVDGKPIGTPAHWLKQDSSLVLSGITAYNKADAPGVEDPADANYHDAKFRWLASDLTAPTDADGYDLASWPEHGHFFVGGVPGPSWTSEWAYRPNVRKRRFPTNKKHKFVIWDESVYFVHTDVNHMWLNFGSPISQPFSWIIMGIIHTYPTAEYGHYLMDAGKASPHKNVAKDTKLVENIGYRNAMLFQKSSSLSASNTESDLTYGKHVRAAHNFRSVPRMFFSVFNGNTSKVGSKDAYNEYIGRGSTDNHSIQKIVLGRRQGWISDNYASHMSIVEIRFFEHALSLAQLRKQYRNLAGTYKVSQIKKPT